MEEHIEFNFRDKTINIPNKLIDDAKNFGILVDNKYLEFLYEKRNSFLPTCDHLFFDLIRDDILNKKYYDIEKGFGKIIVYKTSGVLEYYDNLDAAIFNNWESKIICGFEKLHEKGVVPGIYSVDFFGCTFNLKNSNKYLYELNKLVDEIYVWKDGVRAPRLYNDKFTKNYIGKMSYKDFVNQRVKMYCAKLGSNLDFCNKNSKLKINGLEERIGNYQSGLTALLKRYSKNNDCLFQNVIDLNTLSNVSGIYIFCMDKEAHYYIGQAKKSIKDRIIQHFKQPNSDFDKTHYVDDVSKILYMRVPSDLCNLIESDCIAHVNDKLLCNCLAGGESIISIGTEYYNPRDYIIKKFQFNKILKNFL